MPEAIWFKLCHHSRLVQHGVVAFLGFGRRDVADGLQQPLIVEPAHPFQRRELDGFEGPPGSAPMDDLGFVEAIDGLGERVVIGISNACDRGFDPCLSQPLAVSNADVLGRFNRSAQHPKLGGVYGDGKTEVGAVDAAKVILARSATGVAA